MRGGLNRRFTVRQASNGSEQVQFKNCLSKREAGIHFFLPWNVTGYLHYTIMYLVVTSLK